VPLENKIKYFTTGHKERSCQSYSCREISKLCVSSFCSFKIWSLFSFPYIMIWKGHYSLRRERFGHILWNHWEKKRKRARKKIFQWLYGWDLTVWCTCLQLVVITPSIVQLFPSVKGRHMWVSLSIQATSYSCSWIQVIIVFLIHSYENLFLIK
jgi:hypothetical protein